MTDELDPTLELLRSVFDAPRFDDRAFLDWVYRHNPLGDVVPFDTTEAERRVGHIGGVPTEFRGADRSYRFWVMLNSATAPDTQKKGLWVRSAIDLVDQSAAHGLDGAWGVANDRSTPPAIKHAGFRWVGALPVHLCVPMAWGGRVVSRVADPAFLASETFATLAADLDDFPVTGLVQRWTPEMLAWRLRFPGASYAVHVSRWVVSISTRASFRGVPVAVLLKLLPRGGRRGPMPSSDIVGAACRFHRAPVAVHAGWNLQVPVRGIPLRREWLPSPLNLMFQSRTAGLQEAVGFDIFEFLDFDAY